MTPGSTITATADDRPLSMAGPAGWVTMTMVLALGGSTALLTPSAARACPEAPAPRGTAVFTPDAVIARAAGDLIDHRGTAPVAVRGDLANAYADLSPDGSHLIAVEAVHVAAEGVPPCTRTHLWVRLGAPERVPLPRIARLRGDAVRGTRFSPSGRFVALAVHGLPAEGARRRRGPDLPAVGPDRVHVFDLRTRRRRLLLDGAGVTFLDDRRLVLREPGGRVSLYALRDGERVRVLAPPARRLRPFAEGAETDGFFATARLGAETRFVRVRLVRQQARLEPRGPALTARPQSISRDGSRGAWLEEGRVLVRDLNTGAQVASFSTTGRAETRAVTLSSDGTSLAIISDAGVEVHSLDGDPVTPQAGLGG